MAGKELRTLADQLRKNHGVRLITTFNGALQPGSLIVDKGWNNIDVVGKIALPAGTPINGPYTCMLADFKRNHELKVDASLALLQPNAKAKAALNSVRDVVTTFDSPQTYSIDLLQLEDVLEADAGFWTKAAGQSLLDGKTRVVFEVIRSGISFQFRGAGGIGVNLSMDGMSNLADFDLGASWKWRNEATLQSKNEMPVAIEFAKYEKKKRRFVAES